RMLAVPRVDKEARRRLVHLDARLEGAGFLRAGDRLPRWVASRQNLRYQPALRLAEVVLRNVSASAGAGELPVASFVVPMAKVYEDFVTVALTEALRGRPGRTEAQYPAWPDEE